MRTNHGTKYCHTRWVYSHSITTTFMFNIASKWHFPFTRVRLHLIWGSLNATPLIQFQIVQRAVHLHIIGLCIQDAKTISVMWYYVRSQSIFHALSSSLPRAFADVSNWCWLACRRGVGNGFIILACLQITQRWRIERQLNDVEEEDVDPVTLLMSCSRSRIVLSPEQSRSKSCYHDWVMMTPHFPSLWCEG